jgi:hypothetical protein
MQDGLGNGHPVAWGFGTEEIDGDAHRKVGFASPSK